MERNRLIDGFRGLSIVLVVLGHLIQFRFQDHINNSIIFNLGALSGAVGVNLFFIISGFLITSLLLREEEREGSINVKAFYIRRLFRILPAFYVYLLALVAMTIVGIVHVPYTNIVRSAAFITDLHRLERNWFIGHTWSLSVEEQFYIVWPASLIVFARSRAPLASVIFIILIALSPVAPLANRFSYIAIGSLYAVSPLVKEWIDSVGRRPWAPLLAVVVFAPVFLPEGYLGTAINACGAILLAIVFFGALDRGPIGGLVSLIWLQRLGLISYSVYLWQEISLGPASAGNSWLLRFPLFFMVPAVISYFVIERPFIRIGRKLGGQVGAGWAEQNVILRERMSTLKSNISMI